MKFRFLFILLFSFPVLGCFQRHRSTFDLGNHLYSEYFYFNPAGVDKVYLTDSTNFRVYVGEFDTEHERFSFEFNGDTILIYKTKAGIGRVRIMQDSAKLSRQYLTKNKVNSGEPLITFR